MVAEPRIAVEIVMLDIDRCRRAVVLAGRVDRLRCPAGEVIGHCFGGEQSLAGGTARFRLAALVPPERFRIGADS